MKRYLAIPILMCILCTRVSSDPIGDQMEKISHLVKTCSTFIGMSNALTDQYNKGISDLNTKKKTYKSIPKSSTSSKKLKAAQDYVNALETSLSKSLVCNDAKMMTIMKEQELVTA